MNPTEPGLECFWDAEETKEEPPSEEKQNVIDATSKFIGKRGEKKKSGTISDSRWSKVRADVQRLVDEKSNWQKAEPRHFVALYEMLHEKVYGVRPAELGPTDRAHAVALAKSFRKREFGDDSDAMLAYMKWAWLREEVREKWRRDNNRDGSRIAWRVMFNGTLLTDYRVSAKRKHA